MDKKLSPQPSARKMITIWSLLILCGVLAYGVGLLQGSKYRMQKREIARAMASEASVKDGH
jgi:hypothetical protein